MMMLTLQNMPIEVTLTTRKTHAPRPDQLNVCARFTAPSGDVKQIPAFWAGTNTWKLRYASAEVGQHRYTTVCAEDDDLCGVSGTVDVEAYEGDNPLYRHGSLGRKANAKYLAHQDGTPFFWLADTWWMGFCDRISFPDEFEALVVDRREKGFNVVQIVAGLYPDMLWYDERGRNSAGYPWAKDFSEINPAYFDEAEKRLMLLIEHGIMPCIVGSWGFFMKTAGKEALKRHWKYLIARFAAYPVAWCIAGEANMAFYDEAIDRDAHLRRSRADWNEITSYVREADPFERLITIHPTAFGHEQIETPALLDLDMLQTGHGGFLSLAPTVRMIRSAVARQELPVINSEVCYEGICGSSYADVQRYAYLSCIFSGACGHTYGANGIWQLNGVAAPYGVSPHGAQWGTTSWKEAAALPGSRQIGLCKTYLEKLPWWKFDPHPEWVNPSCGDEWPNGHFAMGIPGETILVFKPHFGGSFFGDIEVGGFAPGNSYRGERFNPITGEVTDMGVFAPDERGRCVTPRVDMFQDWIYLFQRV